MLIPFNPKGNATRFAQYLILTFLLFFFISINKHPLYVNILLLAATIQTFLYFPLKNQSKKFSSRIVTVPYNI